MLKLISGKYEKIHGEIFNPIEQSRLHNRLKTAASYIKNFSDEKIAIDYGCGSGNLTSHLLDMGMSVVCADVSDKFLKSIKAKFGNSKNLSILKVNGRDLSGIRDNYFDLAAIYSVLHHIPDYLFIIRELIRVTKPGGVIYVDHERTEDSWGKDRLYPEFLKQVELNSLPEKNRLSKYFVLSNYTDYISNYLNNIRRWINPRYQPEGDIHVWPDDHIEWSRIEKVFSEQGCEIVLKEDYLLYKNYPLKIYEAFKNKCKDYSLMIVRKKQAI